MLSDLERACALANAAAYEVYGVRNTCVATSHALVAYLEQSGIESGPVRVGAKVFPRCSCAARCYGSGQHCGSVFLGHDLAAAAPGMWRGHLVVVAGDFLLDPTLDQVNKEHVHLHPMVLELPNGWHAGGQAIFTDAEGTEVRYHKYRRQVGWKGKGAARPIQWLPILEEMT